MIGISSGEKNIGLVNRFGLDKYIKTRNDLENKSDYKFRLSEINNKLKVLSVKRPTVSLLEKEIFDDTERSLQGEKEVLEGKISICNIPNELRQIDLGFLGMSKKVKYLTETGEEIAINLPLFGVYDNKNQAFSIKCKLEKGYPYENPNPTPWILREISFDESDYHKLIIDGLRESILYQKIPIRSIYSKKEGLELKFESKFYGFIPESIKNSTSGVQKYFDKIYLIAEAQNYSVSEKFSEIEDPLIIGIKNNLGFIIEEFNCTPIESYVKDLFIKNASKKN